MTTVLGLLVAVAFVLLFSRGEYFARETDRLEEDLRQCHIARKKALAELAVARRYSLRRKP